MECKVLIIDDSVILRKSIRKSVVHAGISDSSIREAGNGRIALDLVKEQVPELVLLDINMPVMDGEQFLQELSQKEVFKRITVLIVSTEKNINRHARLAQLGAKARLHKPFEPEQLISLIKKHLPGKVA